MSDFDPGEVQRARERRHWPLSVHELGREPGDDLSASTTAEERLAMMWPLAVEAWKVAGRPIPDYARAEMPVRVLEFPPGDDDAAA